jgi:hypothetical protein
MRKRRDSQKSGLAGELFVAAELFKRELQVSLTLGNAKSVDLFAYSETTKKKYNIQVKTLRNTNCFPLRIQDVIPDHTYVFVLLNNPGDAVEYFILSGREIIKDERSLYCNGDGHDDRAAVKIGPLKARYRDRWHLFGLERG